MTSTPADRAEPDDIAAVKARLADLVALVHTSSHLPLGVRTALISSLDELDAALANAENAMLHDREQVVRAAEATTHLALQGIPDRPLFERSLKHLADAAHALSEREPLVVAVVSRFIMALTDIGI